MHHSSRDSSISLDEESCFSLHIQFMFTSSSYMAAVGPSELLDSGRKCRPPVLYRLLGGIYRLSSVEIVPLNEAFHESLCTRINRIVIISLFWFQLIGAIFDFCFYSKTWKHASTVDILQASLYWIAAVVFHLLVVKESIKIRRFMRDIEMERFMREHMKLAILINLATLLILLLWLQSSSNIIFPGFHNILSDFIGIDKKSLLGGFFFRFFNFFNFISLTPEMTSMALYCTTLLAFHCWILKRIHLLRIAAKSRDSSKMIFLLSEVKEKMFTFEHLFNMMPVLWLTPEFIHTPQYILFFTGPSDKLRNLEFNIYITLTFAFIRKLLKILLLIMISLVNEQVTSYEDILISEYRGETIPLAKVDKSLSRQLKVTFNQQFTAWRIDPITRSFITSYVASVVTFSTLIVQIQRGSLNQTSPQTQ